MIEYNEKFNFANDVGEFTVLARTEEHPSDYGNGTILRFDIESDYPCERRMLFDVRYADDDMASIARALLKDKFGIEV